MLKISSPRAKVSPFCATLLVAIFSLLLAGCQKPLERKMKFAMDKNATIERDGILYDAESNQTVDGYVKETAEDGVRILYQVSKGKRNGEFLGWHQNGLKKIEGSFRDGKEHGLWSTWDANGSKLWEGNRKDGVLHGRVTRWFKSGSKKIEGLYEKGLKQGEEVIWHRNGRVWQRRNYARGKKDGRWTSFDKEGRLTIEEVYRDDQLIDSKKLPDFWLQPGVRVPPPVIPPPAPTPSE